MKRGMFVMVCMGWALLAQAAEPDVDCNQAMNTLEINHCAGLELKAAQHEMSRYLDAVYAQQADDTELVTAIQTAQQAWAAYAQAHCDSVFTQWRDGTIRGVMAISCQTQLTQERTHTLWENFLTFMDNSEPVLPEPELPRR